MKSNKNMQNVMIYPNQCVYEVMFMEKMNKIMNIYVIEHTNNLNQNLF